MNKNMLGLTGLLVVGAGTLYFSMSGGKPAAIGESSGGTVALAQVSVPAELTEMALVGKVAFEAKCAMCHGVNAAGVDGSGPPLVHKIYEPGHHSDQAFLVAVANGVRSHHWRFGNMPPVEGLTRGDVKGIVSYVRELQRENGI